MTNKCDTVIYTGVTSNLMKRVYEHREGLVEGFTKKYNIKKLVYYENSYNADLAFDGEKALRLIKLNGYDLVFVDHNMPELTGLELIKYIRENNLNTKIVMITGYPAIEGSVVKYLVKICYGRKRDWEALIQFRNG